MWEPGGRLWLEGLVHERQPHVLLELGPNLEEA